ncbi:hypothetical protein [Rubrobacter aplysinae]|uniref:hypothetical protein n=1 Tax=Rubrobacter aplysinae TaxID=909625 RepID=UPI00064C0AC9|nr:hypothetical protein [Rubrobacter aplysinae]
MPQLHLYVPEGTAESLKSRARERGMSVSAYLAEVVAREIGEEGWPEGFFEEVLGGWAGELERPSQEDYEIREALGGEPG